MPKLGARFQNPRLSLGKFGLDFLIISFINYQTDSNLNDPISNFYGASRLKFTYEPDGVNTYYVQNLNNVMYTVDGRRFTNTVG